MCAFMDDEAESVDAYTAANELRSGDVDPNEAAEELNLVGMLRERIDEGEPAE